MKTPRYWTRAARELSREDPVLRTIIAEFKGLALRQRGDPFFTLARAIVGQQISLKAADSVWRRLTTELSVVSPGAVAAANAARLRACGLTARKAEYLGDLASRFMQGLIAPAIWNELDDEALIAELTQVRGIGRWTAEMFLIFHLMRPNVLPLGDIGLRRAMSRHYNRDRPISERKMRAIAENWRPWRSVATWYLWRSLDPVPVEY